VLAQLPDDPRLRCQSPFHWAGAYLLSAALLFGLSFFPTPTAKHGPEAETPPDAAE
jgi:hypothetical protein